jgi:ElaB/YqjD/DUF883 family membrane-anchored ribosome-binding protein
MKHSSDATTDKLIEDFNAVIADTEQLLKSVAAVGGEKAGAMRASVEQNLKAARERLEELQDAALGRARAAAESADDYVRANPWESIGIAAGLGALAGIIIGLMMNRR